MPQQRPDPLGEQFQVLRGIARRGPAERVLGGVGASYAVLDAQVDLRPSDIDPEVTDASSSPSGQLPTL
jgi:hypothetical protein